MGIAISLALATFGGAMLFRARAVREWAIRAYGRDDIARHFRMPGFLLSMRLVGLGCLVFGGLFVALAVAALQAA